MSVLIIGGGRVGSSLAFALQDRGETIVLIERAESLVEELRSRLPNATIVHGDGDEPVVLEEANISAAAAVAAVTNEDEDNLVACLLARREYGVRQTVARVNQQSNAWLFGERFGVDESFSATGFDVAELVRRLTERTDQASPRLD